MAVTKGIVKDVNGDTVFYFTYPSSDVFLKERNYFVFDGVQDDTYIKTVKVGNKTLNFGRYALHLGAKFYLDVSSYYAKYHGKFKVVITYENPSGDDVTITITIKATTYDCYDPFRELVPKACGETLYSMITPPFRMLFIDPSYYIKTTIQSLFVAKTQSGRIWEVNGVDYTSNLVMTSAPITQTNFIAKQKTTSGTVVGTISRIADLADMSSEWVQVKWRTRWGADVSHIFYLDTYATDKDDAQEVESEYLYKEHSKHVIKGSFYLDNIKEPYDLWYYQTLANSELVTITYWRWFVYEGTYIPNGTNSFNGVKITGCNIKDAVVDGVAQSTITFDFELR